MITIQKTVSITIDGAEYETLRHLAHFGSHGIGKVGETPYPLGYDAAQIAEVRNLITAINDEYVAPK